MLRCEREMRVEGMSPCVHRWMVAKFDHTKASRQLSARTDFLPNNMYTEQHRQGNAHPFVDSIARNAVSHQHKQYGKHSKVRAYAYCQFWIHIDYFLLNIICYFRCPDFLTHSFTVGSALATLRPFTGSPLSTLAPVASFLMSVSPMPIRLPSCVIKGTIVLPEKS